jgi:Icc-related predicted phosphoesterase
MPKILLVGDTHCDNIHAINRYIRQLRERDIEIDFWIQVGDWGFWKFHGSVWLEYETGKVEFIKPGFVVHGNHEDPVVACHYTKAGVKYSYKNKTGVFTPKLTHNFKAFRDPFEIVEYQGVRMMGVGGAYCADNPTIRYPHDDEVFLDAIEFWKEQGSPDIDILITHEGPNEVGIKGHPMFAHLGPPGNRNLRVMWEAINPRLHVSGHHHQFVVKYEGEDPQNPRMHMTLPCAEQFAIVLDTDAKIFEKEYLW